MNRFLDWLARPFVAIVTTIIFVLFMIVVLPQVSELTEARVGVSESPDTSLLYSIDSFYHMVESYGSEGRSFYILMRWTFDLVWPLVYGFFLAATIGVLAKGYFKPYQKQLMFVPLVAVDFDYCENIIATFHMAIYPSRVLIFVPLLQVASALKWIVLMAAFAILIMLIGYNIFNGIKRNRLNE